jgi:hypothetical protein
MTMSTRHRTAFRPLFLAALLSGLASLPAAAQTSTFTNFQSHAETAILWCGPAAAQMAMEGYPALKGGPCMISDQSDIWVAIQTKKIEPLWDSDPFGLAGAMSTLCTQGHWVVFSNADAQALMHAAAFWMEQLKFPVVALLDTVPLASFPAHQEHWVTIKGIVTDNDPATHPTVTLQMVWYVDPAVPLGDQPLDQMVVGSVWYSDFKTVAKPGSAFNGKFVALIEPPKVPGRAVAPSRVLTGKVLPKEVIQSRALAAIKASHLAGIGPFRDLAQSKPLEPLLVSPQRGGYYLVPFSTDGRDARLAILLNAYTGDFEGAGSFAPTRLIPQRAAVDSAAAHLGVRDPNRLTATLVTDGRSRFLPVWKVEGDGRAVALDALEPVRTAAPPSRQ